MRRGDPVGDRVARLLNDLELHRPLGLLLHHNRARSDSTALNDIVYLETYQVAPAQLAVDGLIPPTGASRANSDGRHETPFQQQRSL
jgi:hypothetical protein